MTALALSQGIVHLESAILEAVSSMEVDPSTASRVLLSFKEEVNTWVAVLLAHALHLARRFLNNISTKCSTQISKGV